MAVLALLGDDVPRHEAQKQRTEQEHGKAHDGAGDGEGRKVVLEVLARADDGLLNRSHAEFFDEQQDNNLQGHKGAKADVGAAARKEL